MVRDIPDRCSRGHPLDSENLYIRRNGKWECRACRRLRQMAATGHPVKVRGKYRRLGTTRRAMLTAPRRAVIDTLNRLGGEVTNQSGLASTLLADEMGYESEAKSKTGRLSALSSVLGGMEREGMITREIRGKRCFRISLTPEYLTKRDGEYDAMTKAEVMEARREEPEATEETPECEYPPPEDYEPGPGVADVAEVYGQAGVDYATLAQNLLLKAVEAIAHPQNQEQVESLQEVIRAQEAEIRGLRLDLEGLQFRLSTAQADLSRLKEERDTALKLAEEEETGVVTFRQRCEELSAEVDRLKGVVRKYREDEQRRRNGYPVREHLDEEGRRALDEVLRDMSKAPTRRG